MVYDACIYRLYCQTSAESHRTKTVSSIFADEGDASTESLLNTLPPNIKLAVKACLEKRQEAVRQGTVAPAHSRSHWYASL